jgi:hypothetical protein
MNTAQFYTVAEAAAFFRGRNGERASARSLWRWMAKGKKGIRLRFSVQCGQRMISAESLREFLRDTNAAAGGTEDSRPLELSARARLAKARLSQRYGYDT